MGLTKGPGMPDFRVLTGIRYAVGVPERGRHHDSDNDGVADHEDRCLRDPEDLDGFQDDDGCPEEDNDNDGVADDDDECPDDAEEPGGDGDGCPDRPRVVVRKGKMVVYGKVLFPLESADLLPSSEPLIDEMARALKDHPGIRRIEIEGHTDDTGPGEYNLKLSQERAEVVKRALEQPRGGRPAPGPPRLRRKTPRRPQPHQARAGPRTGGSSSRSCRTDRIRPRARAAAGTTLDGPSRRAAPRG